MTRLEGKVVIVTGAGSGIGRACAQLMAREGAAVAVADIRGDAAAEVARTITAAGGRAAAYEVDVSDEPAMHAMITAVVERWDGLDVLHNNAALMDERIADDLPVTEASVDLWQSTLAVNLLGPVLGCKYAIPHMVERGAGSIVNTVTSSALVGDASLPAYGSSKAALVLLTKHVATAYGRQGIRCNALAPGLVRTASSAAKVPERRRAAQERSTTLGRSGSVDEIAEAAVFLASDAASYVTGQVLSVDGGLSCHQPYFAELLDG
jgi:NAD(P)-dependent dehydrogenase (short-subunit alcohol dehydrogenase family)